MSDISKCKGKNCSIKNKCFRYTAKSNPDRQSFNSWEEKDGECEGFYKIKL